MNLTRAVGAWRLARHRVEVLFAVGCLASEPAPLEQAEGRLIGRFLEEELEKMVEAEEDETLWRLRRFVGGLERAHLAFAVCSQFSEMHRDRCLVEHLWSLRAARDPGRPPA